MDIQMLLCRMKQGQEDKAALVGKCVGLQDLWWYQASFSLSPPLLFLDSCIVIPFLRTLYRQVAV